MDYTEECEIYFIFNFILVVLGIIPKVSFTKIVTDSCISCLEAL